MTSEHTYCDKDHVGAAFDSLPSPAASYQLRMAKPQLPFTTPTMASCVPPQRLASTPMSRLRSSPAVMFSSKPRLNPFADFQSAELYSMMTSSSDLAVVYDVHDSMTPADYNFSCSPSTTTFDSPCADPLVWSTAVGGHLDHDRRQSATYAGGIPMSPSQSVVENLVFPCSSESSYAGCSVPATPETIDPAMTIAELPACLTVPDSPLLPPFQVSGSVACGVEPAFSQQSFDGSEYIEDNNYECTPMSWDTVDEAKSPQRALFDPVRDEKITQPAPPHRSRRCPSRIEADAPVRRSSRKRVNRIASPRQLVSSSRARAHHRVPQFTGFPSMPYSEDDGSDHYPSELPEQHRFFGSRGMKSLDQLAVELKVAESTAKGCICPGCGAKFRRPEHLTRHKKSAKHNTAKQYVCDLMRCVEKDGSRKAFNRQDNKTAHIVKTHLTPAFADKGRRDRVTYEEAIILGWDVHFPAAKKEYEKLLIANGGKGPISEIF